MTFICIASLMLVVVDNYTIKILSAVRSYINGESEYSKGQKDALIFLSAFIATEDTVYLNSFRESIDIPIGDNQGRKSLLNGDSDETVSKYFIRGKNHPEDIPGMIWLFKTFRTTYMKTPIKIWSDAEPYIDQLHDIGIDVGSKVSAHTLSENEKMLATKRISAISAKLYKFESSFSEVLGNTARQITTYLLWANILCVLIIVGSIALFADAMIRRLNASNVVLEAKNKEVVEANAELDTLVYSISHDLRSPITSIQGLISVLKAEDSIEKLKDFADDLESIVKTQDVFILEIIDFFQSKRAFLSYTEFSLKQLVESTIAHSRFIPAASDIAITHELDLDMICTDELRLKIIVNNLLSNAIKYSDEQKPNKSIVIKAQKVHDAMEIRIEDNGVGIEKKHMDKIYDMFYAAHRGKGTGLGLYILKHHVEKLSGWVEAQSEVNVGTRFTVVLPLQSSTQLN